MRKFKEYVLDRDLQEGFRLPSGKDLLRSIPISAAILGANFMAGDPFRQQIANMVSPIQSLIKPKDIISSIKVVPKELIRASQFDINKWDTDYAALKAPRGSDIGFATRKDMFDFPVILHVVKHQAMIEDKGDKYIRNAFASPKTNEIFLSDKLFEELPSKVNIGKLNRSGLNILSHELRHMTQNPDYEDKNPQKYRDRSVKDQQYYFDYLNDPSEIGVRLAAIKNLMTKPMLSRIALSVNYDRSRIDLAIKSLPENEKEMLTYILAPKKWANAMYEQKKKDGLDDATQIDHYFKITKAIVDKMSEMNHDIRSLLDHYRFLPNKKEFLNALLNAYDQVVQRKEVQYRTTT